jgi:hypothetical protein
LSRSIVGHDVKTAHQMGWPSVKNGELLTLVAEHFDVFVTVDRNLPSAKLDLLSDRRRHPPRQDQQARRSAAPRAGAAERPRVSPSRYGDASGRLYDPERREEAGDPRLELANLLEDLCRRTGMIAMLC